MAGAEVVTAALRAAITGARPRLEPEPPKPASIDQAARYFGGPREANRAIAQHYGVSIREVQRWRVYERGGEGQKRRPPAGLVKKITTLARRRQLAGWRRENDARRRAFNPSARIRAHGLDMRLRAWIIVSSPPARVHTMPADAGGRPMFQLVDAMLCTPVMRQWDDGHHDAAGVELLSAFFVAYNLPDVTVTDIEWCQVRLR